MCGNNVWKNKGLPNNYRKNLIIRWIERSPNEQKMLLDQSAILDIWNNQVTQERYMQPFLSRISPPFSPFRTVFDVSSSTLQPNSTTWKSGYNIHRQVTEMANQTDNNHLYPYMEMHAQLRSAYHRPKHNNQDLWNQNHELIPAARYPTRGWRIERNQRAADGRTYQRKPAIRDDGYRFDKRIFGCWRCRYVTDRKNNLKRHVIAMHHRCDRALECCGQTFDSKAALRDHVIARHDNGYACVYCRRNFCRKALLKRHLSVHDGRRDHACGECGYATSHKSNLERHRKVHQVHHVTQVRNWTGNDRSSEGNWEVENELERDTVPAYAEEACCSKDEEDDELIDVVY